MLEGAPADVYASLMDGARHAAFTGAPADIAPGVGGAFSAHSGWVSGVNVELEPGRRIVQAWRGKSWPDGHYSLLTLLIEAQAGDRTRLTMHHTGVPIADVEHIASGWHR